jgi:hypothetical protein
MNVGNTIMRVIGTCLIAPSMIYLTQKYNFTLLDAALYMTSLGFCLMKWTY